MSVFELTKKTFVTLDFEGEWLERYGNPEQNFKAIFYGPSGSGKSVEALKLSQYIAENLGRVLYNSHEEGLGKSLQDRVITHEITSKKITFADRMPFKEMCEKALKGRYKTVVIDSVQDMRFTYSNFKRFRDRFPRKSIILINQANARGSLKGSTDILHACDIKARFDGGKITVRSRFLTGYYEGVLFQPKSSKKNHQLTLL